MPLRHTILESLVLFQNVALCARQANSPRRDQNTAAYKLFRILKALTAGDEEDIKAMLDTWLHTVLDDAVPHSSAFNWFWLFP